MKFTVHHGNAGQRASCKWILVLVCFVALLVHSYFAYKEVAKFTYIDKHGFPIHGNSILYLTVFDKARWSFPTLQISGLPAHFGLWGTENFTKPVVCKRMELEIPEQGNPTGSCFPRIVPPVDLGFPRLLGDATCRRWLASCMSVCCCILLGLHVMDWCRSLILSLRQNQCGRCAHFRAAFDNVRQRCKSYAIYELHEGDMQLLDEFVKQRCRYAAMFVAVASPFITMCFVISVMNLNVRYLCFGSSCVSKHTNSGEEGAPSVNQSGKHTDKEVDDHLGQLLIGAEVLPLCFTCVIFLILKRAPSMPTPDLLNRANVLLSGMWIWRFATLPWRYYDQFSSIIWAARLIQGIAFGNRWLSCGLHIIVSLADIFVHAAHKSNHLSEDHVGYALSQFLIIFLACAFTFSFDYLIVSQAKAFLEARRSNHSQVLVHRLLSAMCDCIVQLDSDLCISKECPQLANLLLHRPTLPTYVGQHFAMLLREPDRERFSSHILEEVSLQGTLHDNGLAHPGPHPLHLHLIDAAGTPVSIEMFCSVVKDADGNCTCMVGIKEEADPSAWRDGGQVRPVDQPPSERDFTVTVLDQVDELSSSQPSDDEMSSMVDIDDDGLTNQAVVWIRAELDKWEIVRCSSLFHCLSGQVVRNNDSLCTWVVDQRSRESLENAIINAYRGHTWNRLTVTQDVTKIKLKPPGHEQLTADCFVERGDSSKLNVADVLRDTRPFVRLVFSNLRPRMKKLRGHSRLTSRRQQVKHESQSVHQGEDLTLLSL